MSGNDGRRKRKYIATLTDELENFRSIAENIKPSPGDVPQIAGIDISGETHPLNGVIGGDHLIYLDFAKRFDLDARIAEARRGGHGEVAANLELARTRAGVLLADVAGHRITDHLLAAMLHQAFLLGARYEMDFFGEITARLFENINVRFRKSSRITKFITMVYGEIAGDGTFRFLCAAHPLPKVFSREFDCFVDISPEHLTIFPPIGTMPTRGDIDGKDLTASLGYKERYTANEINLMGTGDILLLFTDGLSEHGGEEHPWFPDRLETILKKVKERPARDIVAAVKNDVLAWACPADDISLVVIKKAS
jgi:serine phosphatase RsbU (regulator of sigma subunit)